MKTYIKNDYVKAYIKALRSRYENFTMKEQYVIKEKRTIETLQYRNERAMMFEMFVRNLVQAVNELEKTR